MLSIKLDADFLCITLFVNDLVNKIVLTDSFSIKYTFAALV